jgi:4'-phosphopantetheinyl transferase EntD
MQIRESLKGRLLASLAAERGLSFKKDSASAIAELQGLDDLSQIPTLAGACISHCREMGGFIYRAPFAPSDDAYLGLDIEQVSRFSAATLERVANTAECKAAPHPGALWVAKEALFKALWKRNRALNATIQRTPTNERSLAQNLRAIPEVISQIEVSNWRELGPSVWSFSCPTQEGRGFCGQADDLLIAIAEARGPRDGQ